MNGKYKLVSDIIKETMNVSVSLPAYESLPTQETKPKKKKKKDNPSLFKTEYPK